MVFALRGQADASASVHQTPGTPDHVRTMRARDFLLNLLQSWAQACLQGHRILFVEDLYGGAGAPVAKATAASATFRLSTSPVKVGLTDPTVTNNAWSAQKALATW